MGVGLHTSGDAHQHLGHHIQLSASGLDPINLVEGVDDDAPHSLLQCEADLLRRFVVAVEAETLGGHPTRQGDLHLTHGGDVQAQPLLSHPPGHSTGQQRLARVVDLPSPEVVAKVPCPSAEVLFVNDVGGSAMRSCQLRQAHSADRDLPLLITVRSDWPHSRKQIVKIRRNREPLRAGLGNIRMDGTRDVSMSHGLKACQRAASESMNLSELTMTEVADPLPVRASLSPRRSPRSSGDRAPPSGGGCRGSNPRGGAEAPGSSATPEPQGVSACHSRPHPRRPAPPAWCMALS